MIKDEIIHKSILEDKLILELNKLKNKILFNSNIKVIFKKDSYNIYNDVDVSKIDKMIEDRINQIKGWYDNVPSLPCDVKDSSFNEWMEWQKKLIDKFI